MANVSFAIHTLGRQRWFVFAMNAIMARTKADVSFAAEQELVTLTIARNVHFSKKIEMAVPRLSIWVLPKQIYFTKEKNLVGNVNNGQDTEGNLKDKENSLYLSLDPNEIILFIGFVPLVSIFFFPYFFSFILYFDCKTN